MFRSTGQILNLLVVFLIFCLGPEIMSKLAGESESNLRKGTGLKKLVLYVQFHGLAFL